MLLTNAKASLDLVRSCVQIKEISKAVLSISFEVDIPTGKVSSRLLFERQTRELPRGVWGQKILKFRCLEMLFSTLSRRYLGLMNNQN